MDELKELKERLKSQRPVEWESLPDLNLYMDQVVGYMPRQLIQYEEAENLTSAMVNNYIKDGLLPRAEGKRYSRVHLAYLTAICALKQVLSVKDAGMLAAPGEGEAAEEVYRRFREKLDTALLTTADRLDETRGEDELTELALELALQSYADRLACLRVIDLIRKNQPAPEGKPKKTKKEKKV